ncbi:MAG TPA: 23S rRNA (guanosine(2251)-2'-O)-methyltransferase RlmB [Thermoanaerobaculia bacterium]
MIIFGANPVIEAIRAHPGRIRWIAVSKEEGRRHQRIVDQARAAGVSVRFVAVRDVDRMTQGAVHNGVAAELAAAEYADFETLAGTARRVFLLDGVTDPQNLGAIIRVADCFGIDMVVVPEHESAGLTPVAVKASAGASEWVPVAQVTNLARAIERLKKEGFWVWGAEAEGERLDRVDLRGKVAIVLGSEGKGIRRNVREHCDGKVAIPLRGHVDSLNVAAAAAVIGWEIERQSGSRGV